MPSKNENILELNQDMKSYMMLYIIYVDLESLIKEQTDVTVNKRRTKITSRSKVCYICEKGILNEPSKIIDYCKVRDHCHYTGK